MAVTTRHGGDDDGTRAIDTLSILYDLSSPFRHFICAQQRKASFELKVRQRSSAYRGRGGILVQGILVEEQQRN
jgi:hypothetical protein